LKKKILSFRKNISILLILILLLHFDFLAVNSQNSLHLNKVGSCFLVVGYSVSIHGKYAYVTNNDGLMIIDVENPKNPKKIAEIPTEDAAFGEAIVSDIVYLASGGSGLVIADITDPSEPEILGQINDGKISYRVAIKDNYAFISYMGDDGFGIYDISDLTNPSLISYYSDSRCDDVKIIDDVLYVANPGAGLRVFNISDPVSPQLLRTISQSYSVHDIYITGNLMYLGRYSDGVQVLDITNPSNPSILDSIDDNDGGESQGVSGNETYMAVADNYGIELFDVSTPSSINKIAEQEIAIVTNEKGTTRDPIKFEFDFDGTIAELIDTAGIGGKKPESLAEKKAENLISGFKKQFIIARK